MPHRLKAIDDGTRWGCWGGPILAVFPSDEAGLDTCVHTVFVIGWGGGGVVMQHTFVYLVPHGDVTSLM
jgi:hypothetical protein